MTIITDTIRSTETKTWPELAEGPYVFLTGPWRDDRVRVREQGDPRPVLDQGVGREREAQARRNRPSSHERARLNGSLSLDGDLVLTVDGHDCAVGATGSTFASRCPRSLRFLVAQRIDEPRPRASVFRLLERRDLTPAIVRGGKTLARFGAAAKSGIVGRLLGIPHVELYPKG